MYDLPILTMGILVDGAYDAAHYHQLRKLTRDFGGTSNIPTGYVAGLPEILIQGAVREWLIDMNIEFELILKWGVITAKPFLRVRKEHAALIKMRWQHA